MRKLIIILSSLSLLLNSCSKANLETATTASSNQPRVGFSEKELDKYLNQIVEDSKKFNYSYNKETREALVRANRPIGYVVHIGDFFEATKNHTFKDYLRVNVLMTQKMVENSTFEIIYNNKSIPSKNIKLTADVDTKEEVSEYVIIFPFEFSQKKEELNNVYLKINNETDQILSIKELRIAIILYETANTKKKKKLLPIIKEVSF